MKKGLLLLSFIEGGAVMCAELCGARLLAPVFGSSLFVWAAVMGITLAALALGYFFGGRYSVSNRQAVHLKLVLAAAALYLLIMPVLAWYIVPRISYLQFIPGMLLSTFLLLMPPIFFLGASSPLFISLQTGSSEAAGKVSGSVYAISTAGGIVSTFLCGFILIPELGLNATLAIHGLLLIAGVFFILRGKLSLFLLAGGCLAILAFRIPSPAGRVYAAEGIYGRVEVVDSYSEGRMVRRLLNNGIIQSEMALHDSVIILSYVKLLDSLLPQRVNGKKALVLGAGGGVAANMLVKKGYSCKAVEFDIRMIDAAKKYFFLSSAVQVVHDDARRFMNHDTSRYDLVVIDVFKAEEQPSHVFTVESLCSLRSRLNKNGALFINWHGYNSGELAAGTRALFNTLYSAGYTASTFFTGTNPHHRNAIIKAVPDKRPPETRLPSANTDNRPTLEKLNAKAGMQWRRNYLLYYQNRSSANDQF